MDSIKLINISLDIFCVLVDSIILFCMITIDYRKEKLNRILIAAVICNFMMLLADAFICVFDSGTGVVTNRLIRSVYLVIFILGPILLIAFTYYLLLFIQSKRVVPKAVRGMAHLVFGVCSADILFSVISQFNHMYYYIDENNMFCRQDWYAVSQVFSFICMIANTAMIISCRKSFAKRELISLSSYVVLPAVAVAVQMFAGGLGVIYYSITLTILIYYVGIQSEQANQLKQKQVELTNARIDVMLSQIRPHFLYNSLAAIQRLCTKDPKLAEETVVEFTRYLRGNLESLSISRPIPFENELLHLETYLAIEKKRFGDRLNIAYEICFDNFYLPALTLQPIAENAVRHGVTKRDEGGTVTIRTEEIETDIVITVTDDGVGFDVNEKEYDGSQHIGIENVRSRLAAMCGGTLTVQSVQGSGTTAVIKIPKGVDFYNEYNSGGR